MANGGVLIITPNGSVIEKASINAAMLHVTQPDPHLVNLRAGMVLWVTTDQQLTANVVIPTGVEFKVSNNAVITLGAWSLTLTDCEFQKPHYNCFDTTGGGVLSLPEAGPVTQNWSIKNLIASGTAAIAGALTGLSAIFSGVVQAAGFTGPLTGNVTGNVTGSAGSATNATGTGTIPLASVGQRILKGHVTTDAGGSASISYGASYADVVVCATDNSNNNTGTAINNTTASGCQVHVTDPSGLPKANASVSWIAMATP